jgi:hypothetical protein
VDTNVGPRTTAAIEIGGPEAVAEAERLVLPAPDRLTHSQLTQIVRAPSVQGAEGDPSLRVALDGTIRRLVSSRPDAAPLIAQAFAATGDFTQIDLIEELPAARLLTERRDLMAAAYVTRARQSAGAGAVAVAGGGGIRGSVWRGCHLRGYRRRARDRGDGGKLRLEGVEAFHQRRFGRRGSLSGDGLRCQHGVVGGRLGAELLLDLAHSGQAEDPARTRRIDGVLRQKPEEDQDRRGCESRAGCRPDDSTGRGRTPRMRPCASGRARRRGSARSGRVGAAPGAWMSFRMEGTPTVRR